LTDLVGLGEADAMLAECKWTSKPAGVDILADLDRKATVIRPELGDRHIHFALFARSGFTMQLVAAAKRRKDILLFGQPEILGK
jgi:hypothetical protein